MICRVRATYTKGSEVRFISHLDLIRVFERAIRRADLPIAYSQGFNPRMKIKYGRALKVGETSQSEPLELGFEANIPEEEVLDRLNRVLPDGVKILTVHRLVHG